MSSVFIEIANAFVAIYGDGQSIIVAGFLLFASYKLTIIVFSIANKYLDKVV